MTQEKRKVSCFIPYVKRDGVPFFFLQRRTADAPTTPGYLGMFGGGIDEGETAEQGLMREVWEELEYVPKRFERVGIFEDARVIKDVFIEEVSDDFPSRVKILEGEYGRFYSMEDLAHEEKVSDINREILREVERRVCVV